MKPLALLAALFAHPVAVDPPPQAVTHARPSTAGLEVLELDRLPPGWWRNDQVVFERAGLFAEARRRDLDNPSCS